MLRHYAQKMGKGLRKQPIGIIENVGAQLVCFKTSQMRQDYPRAASDAKKQGIEELPGSFGPPLLSSFSRGRRDGYHPAVFDAQEEGGVGEAAGRGIEEIPGSFGPPLLGSFSRGGGTAITRRYPMWKREGSRKTKRKSGGPIKPHTRRRLSPLPDPCAFCGEKHHR